MPKLSQPARDRWQAIRDDLRGRVASGQLAVGTMLPSRPELARRYAVALATLERAVSALLIEGVLIAENGRGTFVGAMSQRQADGSSLASLAGRRVGVLCELERDDADGEAAWDPSLVMAVEQHLSRAGATVVVRDRAHPGKWLSIGSGCTQLMASGAEVIVVIGMGHGEIHVDEALRTVESQGVQLVYLAGRAFARALPHVISDNADAGRQAAAYLVAQKCDVLICCAPYALEWEATRASAFAEAARSAGVKLYRVSSATAAAKKIREVQSKGKIPGLFGSNDQAVLAVHAVLHEPGLSLPPSIGVDDSRAARRAGLTSLGPNFFGFGERVAYIAAQTLGGPVARVAQAIPWVLYRRVSIDILSQGHLCSMPV